jgi:PPP family 3-phenylpropionic acid transporter
LIPSNRQELTDSRFARQLALLYASTFMALGVQLPFLPVWLAARGLHPGMIGAVLAVPMILRLLAIPLATRLADHHDSMRATIVATAATALAGFVALGFAIQPMAIAIIYVLAATSFMPLFVLSDVYALRGLSIHRRAYGPIRLWGSAAFVVATLAAGQLFDVIAVDDLIWLIVAAVACCVATACLLPPLETRHASASGAAPPVRMLLRNGAFLTVVAAASLIQGSHALYYGFATIDWQNAGYGGPAIGALWAVGVLAEIVLFALSGRLPAIVTPGVLVMIGAAGAVLRWLAMAFEPPGSALPFLQTLHALSFGATHLGTLGYIARLAPAGLAASAQGLMSVGQGLTMAATTGLSGLLYGNYGATAYDAMALIAGGGLMAAIAAHRIQGNSR